MVLHTIASFKRGLIDKEASLILSGIMECIQKAGPLHNEIITSPDFWVILRTLSTNQQASATVFTILEGVITGEAPPSVMADNYEPVISLLNDFASSGSVGSVLEQKLDRRSRRGQQSKPIKLQYVASNLGCE